MKLSQLTYSYLCSIGLPDSHMHTDSSDALRSLHNEHQFDKAKEDLMTGYGDVDLIITPDAAWNAQIKIDNAKWQEDHEDFCRRKAEFCKKYGCD